LFQRVGDRDVADSAESTGMLYEADERNNSRPAKLMKKIIDTATLLNIVHILNIIQ